MHVAVVAGQIAPATRSGTPGRASDWGGAERGGFVLHPAGSAELAALAGAAAPRTVVMSCNATDGEHRLTGVG